MPAYTTVPGQHHLNPAGPKSSPGRDPEDKHKQPNQGQDEGRTGHAKAIPMTQLQCKGQYHHDAGTVRQDPSSHLSYSVQCVVPRGPHVSPGLPI
jgi:hypothetical protein